MPEVWPGLGCPASTVPMTFVRVDRVTGFALFVVVTHAVEDEKLSFRTKVRDVRDARALKITLRPHSRGPRIERITLSRNGIDRVRHNAERGLGRKWVHPEARGVGNQQHV